jgi:hypothetical protein
MEQNPYLAALALIQRHEGTSGQVALAKCVLSLYDKIHAFALSEIILPLDSEGRQLVLSMTHNYAVHGETPELLTAGKWCYVNLPHLSELSRAMFAARQKVEEQWDREREEQLTRDFPNG